MKKHSGCDSERRWREAEALRASGFFAKAIHAYRRSRAGFLPVEDPVLWIESACAEAGCLRSLGGVKEARALLKKAGELSRRMGLRVFREKLELEDALIDRAEGRYGRSIRRLSAILRRKLALREWEEAAFLFWAIGGALRFQGELAASRQAFRRSLSLAGRAKDPIGGGYALFGLGGVTRVMGRLEESARHYTAALRAFQATDDIFAKAYAQCGLANALRQLGRLRDAERHYLTSRRLYSLLGDEVDLAYVEWGLGKIQLQSGALSRAIPFLERSLKLFGRHRETRGEVLAALALAQARHALGETARGEKLFERACRISRRHGIHAHLEAFT